MKPIEIGQGPFRVFVEGGQTRIINGIYYLELHSGNDIYTFAIPLQLAKGLGKGMIKQIEEIEAQTGQKFDGVTTQENMLSPWQSTPPKKEGEK